MPVALPNLLRPRVQLPRLRPRLAARLEHRRAQAKAHRPAHVRLRDLGHEHDDGLLGVLDELGRGGVRHLEDVARPLDDGKLEAEADAQKGDALLACPLDRENHALGTTFAETTWYEDTAGRHDRFPCFVVFGRLLGLHARFKI